MSVGKHCVSQQDAHRMGRPDHDRAKGCGEVLASRLAEPMAIRGMRPLTRSMLTRRTFLAATCAMESAGAKREYPVPMGLEIYSLHGEAEKDLPATLALIRKFGFKEVEGGDFYGRSAAEFRKLLDSNGL